MFVKIEEVRDKEMIGENMKNNIKRICELAFAEKAATAIEDGYGRDYPSKLTIGLSYRNPRTHNKPMTSGALVDYIREFGRSYWWDVSDNGFELSASAYSGNDMF